MDLMLPETIELFSVPVSGQVKEPIAANRPGRVAAIASTWAARFYNPYCEVEIAPGEPVTVVGRHGIMLLVVPQGHTLPPLPRNARTLEDWRSHLKAIMRSSSQSWRNLAWSTFQKIFPSK